MRLTTKCRHAVTALIYLAERSNTDATVSLTEISAIQGVSLSYLEQLFSKIRQANLVVGTRGPGGGYRLNHPPGLISVADVIDALDDYCRGDRLKLLDKPCQDKRNFAHDKWNEFSRDLYLHLSGVSLAHFMGIKNESQETPHASAAASG
ncbi:MAG: Rrf2 family transcriptional regulator [Halothiobacillus sp.]